jgi:hypothetical protein
MVGTLSERLIPRLLARFSSRGVRIYDGKQPFATFPAADPEVGDLQIDDDDGELTISVGQLTHGHFSPKNYQTPLEEREEEVVGRVIAFLEAVFDDRIEFWTSGRMGIWHERGDSPPSNGPMAAYTRGQARLFARRPYY